PAAGRQRAVLFASAGHDALEPVQDSAGSHTPAEGRQTVALDSKAFAGQAAADPLQASARSQSPAAGRQVVPADLKVHVVVQQEPAVPSSAPPSHCSGAVRTPSPHTAITPTAIDVHPPFAEDL